MKRILLFLFLLLLLLPVTGEALVVQSGDQVTISTPTDDDVIVSGGTVTVNAPVGSLTVAGGTVQVNAPVERDIHAAAGTIIIDADVGGMVMAAGGTVDLGGNATNLVATGGNVRISQNAVVSRDAMISGGTVTNAGTVVGNLSVRGATFENVGTAGSVDFEQERADIGEIALGIGIAWLIMTIGFLLLGIILIALLPGLFSGMSRQIRTDSIKKTIIGFILIIVSAVIILIVALTIIGIPIALVFALLFIVGLLLANLFVSAALGDAIVSRFRWRTGRIGAFILGFVILNILFLIPIVGNLVRLIVVSLGFGAYFAAFQSNRGTIAGEGAPP